MPIQIILILICILIKKAATNPAYLTNLPAPAVAAITPHNGGQSLQSPGSQSLSTANGTLASPGSAAAVAAAAHPQSAAQQQAVAAVAAQHQAHQQHQMALFAAYGYPTAATVPITGQMIPGLTDLHSYGLMALTAHSPQLSLASPTIPTSIAAQTPLSIPNSTAVTNPMLSAASFLPNYLTGAAAQSKPMASVRPMSSVKLEVNAVFLLFDLINRFQNQFINLAIWF